MTRAAHPDTLKLWMIQTRDVWGTSRRDGLWRATKPLVSQDWPDAYGWMVTQMEARLGQASVANQMPLWAWFQWNGSHRPKPDLRASGHLPSNTPGVRIELEVPSDRVLLSDFDLWHYALNYWYLPGFGRRRTSIQREAEIARAVLLPNEASARSVTAQSDRAELGADVRSNKDQPSGHSQDN